MVIIEYEVHGKIIRTGASYHNRFISVITIEGRKIVQWRDYMDSLTAMTALASQAEAANRNQPNRSCGLREKDRLMTLPTCIKRPFL